MPKQAKLFFLVPIIYFSVSGGPYGLEEVVAAVGPFYTLALIILIPVLWTIPETLIVAELSSAFPFHGGYYRWVQLSMGRFWGFMEGWWSILYTLIDLALYPMLFVAYLKILFPHLTFSSIYLIQLIMIWFCVFVNILGIRIVGYLLSGFKIFILLIFLIYTLLCVYKVPVNFDLIVNSSRSINHEDLVYGISLAFWNFIGWDNASTALHEVEKADKNFPKALFITIPFVILSYFFPVLASVSIDQSWSGWSFGQFSKIANYIHSPALAILLAVGGMIMCLGIFNSLMLSSSRVFSVMAGDKLLPQIFSKTHPKYHTPYFSIIFPAILYSFIVLFKFQSLVVIDVFLYLIALFLEAVALIILRQNFKVDPAGFRIPFGELGLVLSVFLVFAVIVGIAVLNLISFCFVPLNSLILVLFVLSGIPAYFIFNNK